MNIVKYKIDEDKLRELIKLAHEQDLKDICLLVNLETLKLIQCQLWEDCTLRLNTADKYPINYYYMDYKFTVDQKLDFGEVKIFGFKHKGCTRITCYSDSTLPKIENNVTEKFFVCIE